MACGPNPAYNPLWKQTKKNEFLHLKHLYKDLHTIVNFTSWPSELKIFTIWAFNKTLVKLWTRETKRRDLVIRCQGTGSLTALLKHLRGLPWDPSEPATRSWRPAATTAAATLKGHCWGSTERDPTLSGVVALAPCHLISVVFYFSLLVVCGAPALASQCLELWLLRAEKLLPINQEGVLTGSKFSDKRCAKILPKWQNVRDREGQWSISK